MKSNRSGAFLKELLQEQQSLTAVARFAQKHERSELPLQSRFYRDLIPLAQPRPGEQYAFEVDLDRCSGCKACVAACHSLNGLEDDESWRSVGLLVNDEPAFPFQQTITTACHHCAEPACLHGCPVQAYEKNPVTGIVHHLDDQCIGCQYCVLKCPYEVPRYSARLGIVRKCDMCAHRLQSGEAPACVQSCPSEAIRITTVTTSGLTAKYRPATEPAPFLPASPAPDYTLPTTVYRSSRSFPATVRAADARELALAEPHWPLIIMLALTQASAGLFAIYSCLLVAGQAAAETSSIVIPGALLGFGGLTASILHLGRPLYAWRAFMGVRRSWLSREIVVFSAFALGMLALLGAEFVPQILPPMLSESNLPWHATTLFGILGVLCSILVYHDTPREFWHWKRTAPQFLGAAVVLGSALAVWLIPGNIAALFTTLIVGTISKLCTMLALLTPISSKSLTPLKRSALLLAHKLRRPLCFRLIVLLLAGIAAPAWWLYRGMPPSPFSAGSIFLLLLSGELAERCLFFRAVAQPKMPGGMP